MLALVWLVLHVNMQVDLCFSHLIGGLVPCTRRSVVLQSPHVDVYVVPCRQEH